MELYEYPLASPLPTTAPHPRDVGRWLLAARQGVIKTCGFYNADFERINYCNASSICAQIPVVNVLDCCPLVDFPNCGTGLTSCVDSVAMAEACTGDCLSNTAVLKCTEGLKTICGVNLYDFSIIGKYLTGFSCYSVSFLNTIYDYYTINGQTTTPFGPPSTAIIPSVNSTSSSTPTPPSTTPTPVTTTQPPVSSTAAVPIPGGAIAGIVIGAVAAIGIIAGLLVFICIRERRRRHDRQPDPANLNPNPGPMMQMPASPPPVNYYISMASMPSATSSIPLTQANIAAMSPRSEVLPSESASQINIPGPVLSQGSPPIYHSGAGLNTASQEHSGLSPLHPGPQYPIGAAGFPTPNVPSVISPGSAFGSMLPVHAPSVTSYRPPGE